MCACVCLDFCRDCGQAVLGCSSSESSRSCFQVVESMRQGMSPKHAAEDAIQRIVRHYPSYVGALIAVDYRGSHGAAAYGWTFEYTVRSHSHDTTVYKVEPVGLPSRHQEVMKHLFGSI